MELKRSIDLSVKKSTNICNLNAKRSSSRAKMRKIIDIMDRHCDILRGIF